MFSGNLYMLSNICLCLLGPSLGYMRCNVMHASVYQSNYFEQGQKQACRTISDGCQRQTQSCISADEAGLWWGLNILKDYGNITTCFFKFWPISVSLKLVYIVLFLHCFVGPVLSDFSQNRTYPRRFNSVNSTSCCEAFKETKQI